LVLSVNTEDSARFVHVSARVPSEESRPALCYKTESKL
jgi:hypothetical protein